MEHPRLRDVAAGSPLSSLSESLSSTSDTTHSTNSSGYDSSGLLSDSPPQGTRVLRLEHVFTDGRELIFARDLQRCAALPLPPPPLGPVAPVMRLQPLHSPWPPHQPLAAVTSRTAALCASAVVQTEPVGADDTSGTVPLAVGRIEALATCTRGSTPPRGEPIHSAVPESPRGAVVCSPPRSPRSHHSVMSPQPQSPPPSQSPPPPPPPPGPAAVAPRSSWYVPSHRVLGHVEFKKLLRGEGMPGAGMGPADFVDPKRPRVVSVRESSPIEAGVREREPYYEREGNYVIEFPFPPSCPSTDTSAEGKQGHRFSDGDRDCCRSAGSYKKSCRHFRCHKGSNCCRQFWSCGGSCGSRKCCRKQSEEPVPCCWCC